MAIWGLALRTCHRDLKAANPLQALLAHIYVDTSARASFLAAPEAFARRHQLDPDETAALASIAGTGLAMAAHSFARKRELKQARH